jgi:hypothetical protein
VPVTVNMPASVNHFEKTKKNHEPAGEPVLGPTGELVPEPSTRI